MELKSNGQIFVKGKKVDNLLLNGKEFFNSDRRLLLDNLGAYTVKNINVYDRWGKDSEFVGRKRVSISSIKIALTETYPLIFRQNMIIVC